MKINVDDKVRYINWEYENFYLKSGTVVEIDKENKLFGEYLIEFDDFIYHEHMGKSLLKSKYIHTFLENIERID